MAEFTALELAVFAAIAAPYEETGDPGLAALLASAKVRGRDVTGHGFFTNFAVDRSLTPLGVRLSVVHGPDLLVSLGPQLLQMGFVLWVDDAGYPECLEGFQYAVRPAGAFDLDGADLARLAPANDRSYGGG
jgi:hypothetical protein